MVQMPSLRRSEPEDVLRLRVMGSQLLHWFEKLQIKLGVVPMRRGRSVVVVPADRPAMDAASELLTELRHRYPRLNIVFVVGAPALRAWLSARFSNDRVVPFPMLFGPLLGLFLHGLRAQLVLILGAMDAPAQLLLARALDRGIAGVIIGSDQSMLVHPPREITIPAARRNAGPDRLQVTGPLEQANAQAIANRLAPLIAHERFERQSRAAQVLAGLVRRRLIAAPEGRWLAGLIGRKYESFTTLGELRTALGNPRSILCLGNGPSSEGTRVRSVDFDCLFRVNHSWLARGFLTEPDAVFTGSMPTIRAVRRPVIFCLSDLRAEERLIVRGLLMFRRFRFAGIARYGLIDTNRFGAYQPTNGAMMLATAVALRPERLVVAGIDLFQDARGAYPGDGATPNAYTPTHDRDMELNFILNLLAGYDGELVVLSPVLDEHWRTYRAERPKVADHGKV